MYPTYVTNENTEYGNHIKKHNPNASLKSEYIIDITFHHPTPNYNPFSTICDKLREENWFQTEWKIYGDSILYSYTGNSYTFEEINARTSGVEGYYFITFNPDFMFYSVKKSSNKALQIICTDDCPSDKTELLRNIAYSTIANDGIEQLYVRMNYVFPYYANINSLYETAKHNGWKHIDNILYIFQNPTHYSKYPVTNIYETVIRSPDYYVIIICNEENEETPIVRISQNINEKELQTLLLSFQQCI